MNMKHIPRRLQEAAGWPTRFKLRRQAARFLARTSDCRRTQQHVLQRLLALNSDSQFSQQHGLNRVRTSRELRQRLPITDYEYFRCPIDQLKSGNHGALLGEQNELLMFTLSSPTAKVTRPADPHLPAFFGERGRNGSSWIGTTASSPVT